MLEVEAIEKISEVSPVGMTAPVLEQVDPLTHYDQSSVTRAEGCVGVRPSKPDLPPMCRLGEIMHQLDDLNSRFAKLTETRVEDNNASIRRIHEEQSAALAEAAKRKEDVSFWGFLEDMGSTCLSAVSSVFGYSLYTTNAPIAGGLLIAGGVLSIGNLIAKHTDAWSWIASSLSGGDEQTEEAIKTYVPAAVGAVAAVCALAGTAGAWYWAHLTDTQKALSTLQAVSSLVAGSSAAGSGVAKSRMKWTEGNLSTLRFKGEKHKLALENAMADLKDTLEVFAKITEKAGSTLKALMRGIQATQQAV